MRTKRSFPRHEYGFAKGHVSFMSKRKGILLGGVGEGNDLLDRIPTSSLTIGASHRDRSQSTLVTLRTSQDWQSRAEIMDLFKVAAVLLQALLTRDGELESAIVLSFSEEATVCLRAPYGTCGISRCEGIDEDQMALDIGTPSGHVSYIFGRTTFAELGGEYKTILPREECLLVPAANTVSFQIIEEKRHSVSIRIEAR